ncbi:MAG: isoprenoid biosynthesis glyoxalase ElbB [bacterium]
MGKKIGVLLSGCGVMDGAEIHESVLTLLAIDNAGAEAVCMAPNADQLHVINHLTNQPTGEKRNCLVEAARIARGKIKDLAQVKAADIDALVIPGGYGAAKNLCTWAIEGNNCKVHPEVRRLIREIVAAKKPLAAICISPVVVAKVLEDDMLQPALTIGNDSETASNLQAMGADHQDCPVKEFVVDEKNKIVSTPAYMLARSISEAAVGIEKMIKKLIEMA